MEFYVDVALLLAITRGGNSSSVNLDDGRRSYDFRDWDDDGLLVDVFLVRSQSQMIWQAVHPVK